MSTKPKAHELRLIRTLNEPPLVQQFLDRFAYNHEEQGATIRTFRGVLRAKKAHCLEAALFAATVLEHHGCPPLLLDLRSWDALDHVLFLYRIDGRWGSIARSRDPGLHGRKPVFASLSELVQSYHAPYVDLTGRIRGYSVFDLRKLKRCNWRFSERNVWAVERALQNNPGHRCAMPDQEYDYWHRRYRRYKKRYHDKKPRYFPDKQRWLSAGPPAP